MHKVNHNKNIINIKNVSFSYNGNEDILKNITLSIHPGDYIGLVGPNGAGKTTLLKIMVNLLIAKNGTVELFGEDIKNFNDWQKIGYVPQKAINFDTNFPASVYEVVLMGRYSKKSIFQRTTLKDKKSVKDALEKINMWQYKDKLIGALSGGQQQRIFIARALVNDPKIIFLDEPTAGIDEKTKDDFYALLQKLNKKFKITLVLVSHDIERVTREVMHIACIDKTLTYHASPQEYFSGSRSSNILGKNVKIITHHHHH
ncbi:MAG: metal ABC transporter ATP-binding protein [Candidatus Falkowbacteria bacterium]|nr:metal ABC transporter ATP-binding protein [Candidatus Falkowbacteria bacterium]